MSEKPNTLTEISPESLLALASEAIAKRTGSRIAPCQIGFENGLIFCVPVYYYCPNFKAIIQVSPFEMNRGFTTSRWRKIGAKLYEYWKENTKCQKNLTL